MQQMKNDERENDEPADHHVARREAGLHVFLLRVTFRSGAAILDRKLDREINVKNHRHEQNDADGPEQRAQIAQMLRVTVHPIRSQKNLQISEQMPDNKEDQNDPRDRDDEFFPDGRAIKSRRCSHVKSAQQRCAQTRSD